MSSLLLVILACFLDSCSTTDLLTSDVTSTDVIDLQYFEPVPDVTLIYDENTKILSDSLSDVSKQLLNEIVQEFKDKISLTGSIIVTNNTLKQRFDKDVEKLVMTANDIKHSSISSIRITPLIDSLLESNNKRFGLITVESGYIKTDPYYAKQIFAGAFLNIISWFIFAGSTYPPYYHPNKGYSELYVMIVDAGEGNIAF